MKYFRISCTTLEKVMKFMEENPTEEVLLSDDDKPLFKLSRMNTELTPENEEVLRKRGWGAAKGKLNLPPDFDEVFVALDAEIWREVADSYEVKK